MHIVSLNVMFGHFPALFPLQNIYDAFDIFPDCWESSHFIPIFITNVISELVPQQISNLLTGSRSECQLSASLYGNPGFWTNWHGFHPLAQQTIDNSRKTHQHIFNTCKPTTTNPRSKFEVKDESKAKMPNFVKPCLQWENKMFCSQDPEYFTPGVCYWSQHLWVTFILLTKTVYNILISVRWVGFSTDIPWVNFLTCTHTCEHCTLHQMGTYNQI